MSSSSPPRPGATTEQLRDAIDRGRTGSKVPARDPAAAPLGTDDEAGGTPTDPRVVQETLERETANRAAHPVGTRQPPGSAPPDSDEGC
jgi:hypothetical protein